MLYLSIILASVTITVLIVEVILAAKWRPFYCRQGLRLFKKSIPDVLDLPELSPESLAETFATPMPPIMPGYRPPPADAPRSRVIWPREHLASGGGVPLIFKQVTPREIAFRGPIIQGRTAPTQPMRGLIVYNPQTREVSVVGVMSWSFLVVIAWLTCLIVWPMGDAGVWFKSIFLGVAVIIWLLCYLSQRRLFTSVQEVVMSQIQGEFPTSSPDSFRRSEA